MLVKDLANSKIMLTFAVSKIQKSTIMKMYVKTNKNEKMFLVIVEGGLDWCASEDALVESFSTYEEADKLGFSSTEFDLFNQLQVGETAEDCFDYEGVHVMRVR